MRRFAMSMLALLLLATVPEVRGAGTDQHSGKPLRKILGSPTWSRFNVNNISTTVNVDGRSDWNLTGIGSGLYFPKGSGRGTVYASGIIWGARAGSEGDIRIGGAPYATSLVPGRILDTLHAESPDLPENRIYRVRPDIPPDNQTADISSELADGEGTTESILNQYHKDWLEWPAGRGAPFQDKNNDGIYEPSIDIPGVPDADQTLWGVACDLPGPDPHFSTPSLGLEVRTTVWGYRSEGALGNMLFRRYVLINRNTIPFDSMYVAYWADVDDGNAGDDLAGCDTTRSLGFVYNGQERDAEYSPLPPPAIGFDFFQGPVVPGTGLDSAIFGGRWIPGFRNLPMTAFFANTYDALDPVLKDPLEFIGYYGAIRLYNAMQGLVGDPGEPYIDPSSGLATRFPFAGDPERRTGWLDGTYGLTFGDRRIGVASGPFTMAPGDTQEIVVAEICAGAFAGCDRLSAVGLLKFYDDQAQEAYDRSFAVPKPPTMPRVNATALDHEIILDWGNDSAAVAAAESVAPLGYAFEGYNVYQLPSASASVTERKRLATFDVVNGIGKIIDEEFDPGQGSVLPKVKEVGTDNGVQRWYRFATDAYNNDHQLVDGDPYYLAVTAYNYNPTPGIVPATLESDPVVMTVVPHSPDPGTRYAARFNDTLSPVVHTSLPGLIPSDGSVVVRVVNPANLTGHQYEVSFDTAEGNTFWNLKDLATGALRLTQQQNQSGDKNYRVVDGLQVIVSGPLPGWKDWTIPNGARRFTWAGGDLFGLEGFGGAMGNARDFHANVLGIPGPGVPYTDLKNVLLKLAPAKADGTVPSNDENVSYGYRFLRLAASPPAQPAFAPFIVNTASGYPFQDYVPGIPFSAWDVEANPPRRLAVAFLENNVIDGRVDGKWWPDTAWVDNCTGSSPREWFWIMDAPYSGATPDLRFETNALTDPGLPFMWVSLANRRTPDDWEAGDEFLILVNHANAPGNTFSFTTPANVTGDLALAQNDVRQINVFPNPYYGVNPQELNKYQRFVTFNHLPRKATIRIFNLGGVMVRTIQRESDSQFERWDLKNDAGLPVGSGLYIAYIDMPDLGVTKILKIAIVQEQQILDRY